LPFIFLAIFVLLCSLNIRGYIDPEHPKMRIDFLYDMSKPGGLFDKQGSFAFIPSIL